VEEKIQTVVKKYNWTYHSAIKCTPVEAWTDESGMAQVQNSRKGEYARRFIVRSRERFRPGQEVRIAKRENPGNVAKEEM